MAIGRRGDTVYRGEIGPREVDAFPAGRWEPLCTILDVQPEEPLTPEELTRAEQAWTSSWWTTAAPTSVCWWWTPSSTARTASGCTPSLRHDTAPKGLCPFWAVKKCAPQGAFFQPVEKSGCVASGSRVSRQAEGSRPTRAAAFMAFDRGLNQYTRAGSSPLRTRRAPWARASSSSSPGYTVMGAIQPTISVMASTVS